MSQSKKKKQRAAQKTAKAPKVTAQTSASSPRQWLWIAAIAVLGFIAFSPILQAEFVNYDDDYYAVENPLLVNPTGENLKTLYTTYYGNQYSPVGMTIMALEIQLFGADPAALKFISILFHLINALLVFFFVKKLFGRLDYAVITAGLFTLHTLQVESVAWLAASMKVSTYTLFFLASLITYLVYLEKKKAAWLVLSLGLFALSAMCKEQAVVLSLVLVAIDYLKKRDLLSRQVLLEKVPFFVVSLIFGLVTMGVADEMRGTEQALPYYLFERMLFATYALTAYAAKHILPVNLSTYYLYPPEGHIPAVYYLTPVVCLAILAGLIYAWKKDQRLIVFGLAFFLINLILTIFSQVFSVRDVMMADRYVYLSSIGFFLILAYWLGQLMEKRPGLKTGILAGLGIYALILAGMTYVRCGVWQNSITMFSDAIEKGRMGPDVPCSPALGLPYTNRGLAYKVQGNLDAAMADYEQAIICNPSYSKAHLNKGNIFFARNQDNEAIQNYDKAIELDPVNAKAYSSRGAAYARKGMLEQSEKDLSRAVELDPNLKDAYSNRALVYYSLRNYDPALADLDYLLRQNPNDGDLLAFKGSVLVQLKRFPEAETTLNQAIQLNPGNGLYYLNRSFLYRDMGDRSRARQDASQAKALGAQVDPGYLNSLN